jgi:hypothetical protein
LERFAEVSQQLIVVAACSVKPKLEAHKGETTATSGSL